MAVRPTDAVGAKALADVTASARMAAEIFIFASNVSVLEWNEVYERSIVSASKVAVIKIDKSLSCDSFSSQVPR